LYDAAMRWVIGDIHGCAREFDDLLQHIRFDRTVDELWCAGDLVNTGPESLEVLRLWRDSGGHTVIGNHDVYALLSRSGRSPRRKDRLDAVYAAPDGDALLARLRSGPAMVRFTRDIAPTGVWLVHAGVHPRWTDLAAVAARVASQPHDDDWMQSADVTFVTRVRCCDGFGERSRFTGRPQDVPPPYRAWDEYYEGDDLIAHGHWAMRGFYRNTKTIGLDSACVYGGRLTAWCLDDDRIESVPCRSARGYLV
jgi:bis(5'-nucleosyl)-tetraphosphatase (symmetrical)